MPKGIVHILLLTGFLLSLFLLLPVQAEENGEWPTSYASVDKARFSTASNQTHKQFLPVIISPPLEIVSGELRLDTENSRAEGLTIFTLSDGGDGGQQYLDAKGMLFNYSPVEVRVCQDVSFDNCGEWVEKVVKVPFPNIADLSIGLNQVIVEFQHKAVSPGPEPPTTTLTTARTLLQSFTFFYIPNGDFRDVNIENWLLQATLTAPPPSDTNPELQKPKVDIDNDKLLLDPFETRSCTEAYRSSISASLIIQLPPHSDYKLHIEGTVYTQDMNPSDTATYDSFEVAINNQLIQRYSNQQPPITCSNPLFRQRPVELQVPLNNYAGQIVLSLENHLRYDHYFYTYTEIDTVWIDK